MKKSSASSQQNASSSHARQPEKNISAAEEAISRRTFLGALVQIGAVSATFCAVNGCANSETGVASDNSAQNSNVAVGGPIPVAAQQVGAAWRVSGGAKVPVGQALFFEMREGDAPPRTGYLLREGQNWRALDAKCPHAGCDVEWRSDAFQCPCHASSFTRAGKRTGGPATRDLTRWRVQIQNDDALISPV